MKANVLVLTLLVSGCAGLVSCSPDKKKEDSLKLSEPTIIKGQGKVEWNPFAESVDKSLDLTDKIAFKSAPPSRLHIATTCTSGSLAFNSETSLPLAPEINVFEFFDEKFIARSTPQQSMECTFSFTAQNDSGGKHVFFLQGVKITDSAKNYPIQVLKTDSSLDLKTISSGDEMVLVQMADADYDQLRLQCLDMRYESGDLGTQFPMIQLVAIGAKFETNEQALSQRPAQRCRIISYKKNRKSGISPSFVYLQANILPQFVDLRPFNTLGGLIDNLKFNILEFDVTNSNSVAVRLKIPKVLPDVNVYIASRAHLNSFRPIGASNFPTSGLAKITVNKGTLINESPEEFLIELPAKAYARVVVTAAPRVRCSGIPLAASVLASGFYEIKISEDLGNETLEAPIYEFDTTRKLNFGLDTIERLYANFPHEGKGWCRNN